MIVLYCRIGIAENLFGREGTFLRRARFAELGETEITLVSAPSKANFTMCVTSYALPATERSKDFARI